MSLLAAIYASMGAQSLRTTRTAGCMHPGSQSFQLHMENNTLVEETTFLDYVIVSVEIWLVIIIDFTASNLCSAQPGPLHFWN